MKIKYLVPWLIMACLIVAGLDAWPDPQHINVPTGAMLGWDNASSSWKPVAIDGNGVLQSATSASSTTTISGTIQTMDVPLATPTITNVICQATPGIITAPASRAYLIIQNHHATESAYVTVGTTATPGLGIEVQAGDSILRPWGANVTVAYASTDSLSLTIEQGVLP